MLKIAFPPLQIKNYDHFSHCVLLLNKTSVVHLIYGIVNNLKLYVRRSNQTYLYGQIISKPYRELKILYTTN